MRKIAVLILAAALSGCAAGPQSANTDAEDAAMLMGVSTFMRPGISCWTAGALTTCR